GGPDTPGQHLVREIIFEGDIRMARRGRLASRPKRPRAEQHPADGGRAELRRLDDHLGRLQIDEAAEKKRLKRRIRGLVAKRTRGEKRAFRAEGDNAKPRRRDVQRRPIKIRMARRIGNDVIGMGKKRALPFQQRLCLGASFFEFSLLEHLLVIGRDHRIENKRPAPCPREVCRSGHVALAKGGQPDEIWRFHAFQRGFQMPGAAEAGVKVDNPPAKVAKGMLEDAVAGIIGIETPPPEDGPLLDLFNLHDARSSSPMTRVSGRSARNASRSTRTSRPRGRDISGSEAREKSTTVLQPTAAIRCSGPVSLPTASSAPAPSEARSPSSVRAERSMASGQASRMVSIASASALPPIRTGVIPCAVRYSASSAKRIAGQRFSGRCADPPGTSSA